MREEGEGREEASERGKEKCTQLMCLAIAEKFIHFL